MPDPFDVLAALIRVDRTPDLAVAARSLAAAGVPVLPCQPDGKRPLTRRGFLDATSDLAQVATWWSRTPDANIGLPTGAPSGVVVVDVDVHGPVDGRAAWRRASAEGLVDGAGLLVRTPTGGAHAYFPATPYANTSPTCSEQNAVGGQPSVPSTATAQRVPSRWPSHHRNAGSATSGTPALRERNIHSSTSSGTWDSKSEAPSSVRKTHQ